MNKISINQRLNSFLEKKEILSEDFKKSIGVKSRQQVSNWRTLSDPIPDKHLISIITVYPELNANWLLTGDGKMLSTEETYKIQVPDQEKVSEANVNYGKCPACRDKDKTIEVMEKHIRLLEFSLGKTGKVALE